MRSNAGPPRDPPWLTGPRVAMAVAALGGGAFAAWLFRCIVSISVLFTEDPSGAVGRGPIIEARWLEIVLFTGTFLLTMRAVQKSLESSEPQAWALKCALYGAINGGVCSAAFFCTELPRSELAVLICIAPFAMIVGVFFGLAFFVGYAPMLALARRAKLEPSLDLLTRMVPWCAGWLTAIALVVSFVGVRQIALGVGCVALSALLLGHGLLADQRRRRFLDRLDRARDHRFARGRDDIAVLPFVAGLGDPSHTLVAEERAGNGPFRSAVTEHALAAFSDDPHRERGRLTVRQIALSLLLASDLALAYFALA